MQVKLYENQWLNESIITKVTCVANVIVRSIHLIFKIVYKTTNLWLILVRKYANWMHVYIKNKYRHMIIKIFTSDSFSYCKIWLFRPQCGQITKEVCILLKQKTSHFARKSLLDSLWEGGSLKILSINPYQVATHFKDKRYNTIIRIAQTN